LPEPSPFLSRDTFEITAILLLVAGYMISVTIYRRMTDES